MLLVILGAGASYDAVPQTSWSATMRTGDRMDVRNFRPPLANELFENRPNFSEVLARFPMCAPLITTLRRQMSEPEFSVERELRQVQDKAEEYPRYHQQLAAVQFYLQHVIWDCGTKWYTESSGASNYAELLVRLEQWALRTRNRVCMVTFNYDTLLETAAKDVMGLRFDHLFDYIELDEFKFIKPHGSVNWTRPVRVPLSTPNYESDDDAARIALIRRAPYYKLGDFTIRPPSVTPQDATSLGKSIHAPAISIPVEKKAEFACPPRHISVLTELLSEVDRVLIIGWRATEFDFLELLKPVGGRIRAWLVVNGPRSTNEVSVNLQRGAGLAEFNFLHRADYGFSELFAYDDLDRFLQFM